YEGCRPTSLPPCLIARRGIGRTFQKTSVFPALSVEDNVLTGLHLRGTAGFLVVLAGRRRLAAEERALSAEAADIIEFVGLAHRRHEPASALPYGEQRLVELGVALAARPRLLPLDEPGAGMTGSEKLVVSGLIRRVRDQGVTVLLVEHDMRMVMGISDTVIVLNGGPGSARGRPGGLPPHPEVIRAYLGGSAASA